MRYIKEYNEEVSKMEEVSEYLQEIFDKHRIVRRDKTSNDLDVYGHRKIWIKFYRDLVNKTREAICVVIDDDDLMYKVNKEIYDMIPQLEKRSGIMLHAASYPEFHQIVIEQIYRRFGKKNMYLKESKVKNLYEELSDYLQEFFDEFGIVEVKPGSWKKLDAFLYNTWCLLRHKDTYGDENWKIHIHIKDDIYDDAKKYILRIKSNIEKRMDRELQIQTILPLSKFFQILMEIQKIQHHM